MEDFKWLFYVLGAIIILVLRMWNKAFQSPKTTASNRPAPPKVYPVPAPPATSYQDILREMQAPGERAKKTVSPIPVSLERNIPAERRAIPARSLERTDKPVKSLETTVRTLSEIARKPSAIELARRTKTRVAVTLPPAVSYGKLLQNPQNVRNAFILAEILNRRIDY